MFINSKQNLLQTDGYLMTFGPGDVALNVTVLLYESIKVFTLNILVSRVL